MLKRFISYYRPHWKMFAIDMCCAFVISAADLFYPVVSGNIIDEYIPQKNLRMLLIWCALLLGIYILRSALNYVVQYFGHMVGVRMQAAAELDRFH